MIILIACLLIEDASRSNYILLLCYVSVVFYRNFVLLKCCYFKFQQVHFNEVDLDVLFHKLLGLFFYKILQYYKTMYSIPRSVACELHVFWDIKKIINIAVIRCLWTRIIISVFHWLYHPILIAYTWRRYFMLSSFRNYHIS